MVEMELLVLRYIMTSASKHKLNVAPVLYQCFNICGMSCHCSEAIEFVMSLLNSEQNRIICSKDVSH